MAILSITSFVDELIQSQLLDADQQNELHRLQLNARDARTLAHEILRRDWLTAYQINQILLGKGAGLTLGPYVLLERIGEGGMGQVYKSRQKMLNRVIALKVIRKECLENPRAVARFMREIRAAGQLSHPHIVRAYDADQVNGVYYIAMEYIDGIDLAHLVKKNGPLPVAQACEYIRQAALGLQHAHERGLVHRDIKPANLLMTKAVPSDRRRSSGMIPRPNLDAKKSGLTPRLDMQQYQWGLIKILDMGLVRCTDPFTGRSATHLTQVGSVMGTPEFIAPEQARDSHASDIRSDIYSLGCTLYYLLTGQPPFPHGTLTEKLLQHQIDEPESVAVVRRHRFATQKLPEGAPRPTEGDAHIPAVIVKLVHRLLAKRPEDRFETPLDLANELQSILTQLANGTLPPDEAAEKTTEELPILSESLTSAAASPSATTEHDDEAVILARRKRRGIPVMPILLGMAGIFVFLMLFTVVAVVLARSQAMQAAPALPEPPKSKADEMPWKRTLKKALQKRATWDEARDELMRHRATTPPEQLKRIDELLIQLPTPMDSLERTKFEAILPAATPAEVVALYGLSKPFAPKQVHSVAVSANGRWIATNEDAGIRLYDVATGSYLPYKILAHDGRIHRVALSPDGRLAASASEDGTARVWDVATRNRIASFPAHQKPVTQLAWHPDGSQIATAGKDGFIRIWDPRTGGESRKLDPQVAEVLSLAFSPSGKEIFWTGHNSEIRWTPTKETAVVNRFDMKVAGCRSIAFQPHGNLILCSGMQGQAFVGTWDGTVAEKTILKNQSQIHQLVFAPNGQMFATVGADPMIAIWDAQTLKVQKPLSLLRAPGQSVAFSPEGRHLVVGGVQNQVFVIRLASPDLDMLAKAVE